MRRISLTLAPKCLVTKCLYFLIPNLGCNIYCFYCNTYHEYYDKRIQFIVSLRLFCDKHNQFKQQTLLHCTYNDKTIPNNSVFQYVCVCYLVPVSNDLTISVCLKNNASNKNHK